MSFAKPQTFRRFLKHPGGATAVEFALLMVPLIAIILAILQTALVFFLNQALQTVVEKTGRQLLTGSAQTSGLTQSQFQSTACGYAPSIFQCANLMVDVQSASSFSAITTTPLTLTFNSSGAVSNTWNYSPGNAGDIVIVRLMYDWPIVGGPLGVLLANQSNGTRLLMATAVFKNEPYQ